MFKLLKRKIDEYFPLQAQRYRAYKGLFKLFDSYLISTGWIQSFEQKKPINFEGEFIPWMNYPVVKLLDQRFSTDFNLFEFGSGYSTHFYAKRCGSVVSVEYDRQWYDVINKDMPENVSLLFQEKDVDGYYCRLIAEQGKRFDVVVVDGRDRVNCVKQSLPCLTERGVIILDDSHRDKYKEGIAFAEKNGFRSITIEGLKPTECKVATTTILYRDGNCLGI